MLFIVFFLLFNVVRNMVMDASENTVARRKWRVCLLFLVFWCLLDCLNHVYRGRFVIRFIKVFNNNCWDESKTTWPLWSHPHLVYIPWHCHHLLHLLSHYLCYQVSHDIATTTKWTSSNRAANTTCTWTWIFDGFPAISRVNFLSDVVTVFISILLSVVVYSGELIVVCKNSWNVGWRTGCRRLICFRHFFFLKFVKSGIFWKVFDLVLTVHECAMLVVVYI